MFFVTEKLLFFDEFPNPFSKAAIQGKMHSRILKGSST